MHTDKSYMASRERINDALRKRVVESSLSPHEERRSCACNSKQPPTQYSQRSWGLEGYPLASMYAPLQSWQNLYDEDLGFQRGTIFKELDLPFVCGEKRGGGCRDK